MGNFRFNPVTGTMETVKSQVPEESKKDELNKIPIVDKNKVNAPINEGIVQFRSKSDYTIFQFVEPNTQSVLGYIGGYALDFSFNLEHVGNTERLEQLLEGIKGLFRKMISEQILKEAGKK